MTHLTKSEAITLFNMSDLILINGKKVYRKGSADDFHTYYLKAHDEYYNDSFIVSDKGVYKQSDGHITIPGYDCKIELFKNLFNQ